MSQFLEQGSAWENLPGSCPDFNNVLQLNAEKLEKMRNLLVDLANVQHRFAAELERTYSRIVGLE